MTSLREQIEALPGIGGKGLLVSRAAILDIIDQHECSEGEKAAREYVESITVVCTRPHLDDRDALARALQETILTSIDKYRGPGGGAYRTPWADLTAVARRHVLQDADAILAALKEQDDAKD